jgi:nitroreductase
MKDDLHTFLRSPRSVRRFTTDPIPDDMIERILETAICTPSMHNLQPWVFVVVTGSEAKSRLVKTIKDRFRQDRITDGFPEADIQARKPRTRSRSEKQPLSLSFASTPPKSNLSRTFFRSKENLS